MRQAIFATVVIALASLAAPAASEDDWAGIDGFRSAKFGMTAGEVKAAIENDFGVGDDDIATLENPVEKTTVVAVRVEDLIPDTGPARVYYILGYKTEKLIQVNVVWQPQEPGRADAQRLVGAARILQDHFTGKPFPEDNVVANVPVEGRRILVFRGADAQGRTALVVLNLPTGDGGGTDAEEEDRSGDQGGAGSAAAAESGAGAGTPEGRRFSLVLSYIENPESPDTYQPGAEDF